MALSEQDKSQIKTLLKREATTVEEHIFDTMWSEHCSYKSSRSVLKQLPTKGSEVALGIGEDSGIVRLTNFNGTSYCIAVSHESHNHPSQILPVEGAATGVGGVVRDVYCMGADVIGVLNSLHFGINDDGKSPIVDEIAERVVFGVSDYANPLGVPVLGGETVYHSSYNDNCLVNVAALGLVEEDNIIHSYVPKQAKNEPYVLILIGKSTDSTGFGGASFSSATLDNETANLGAVQVHDPFLKRVLVEALKEVVKVVQDEKVAVGYKDLGAGGIACAGSEIAAAGGFGVDIDLDKVNVALDSLPPEVVACSETQERFCMAVPEHFAPTVLKIINEDFDIPKIYPHAGAVVVGKITENTDFYLSSKGKNVCSLPIEAITTDVRVEREFEHRDCVKEPVSSPKLSGKQLQDLAFSMIKEENGQSKRYVYRSFDNAVRGDTVIYPGEADAVVVTPIENCNVGVATSIDSNFFGETDPYTSGAYAVAEGVRNVIAVGARPIAVTDCLNYGNPEKPDVFFDFKEGVRGITDAAQNLGFIDGEPLPVISGNVSFYNESKKGRAIVPSPVTVVIGKVEDYRKSITMQCSNIGESLIRIGQSYGEFSGTLVARLRNDLSSSAPQVRFDEEARQNKAVLQVIQLGWASACHDISVGGAWMTLCEMALGERGQARVGMELNLESSQDLFQFLFSENGGYILSIRPEYKDEIVAYLKQTQVHWQSIGTTTSEKILHIKQGTQTEILCNTKELSQIWNDTNDKRS